MDIRHILDFDSDSSIVPTYGVALARYKAGTLDPKLKERMDRMLTRSLESINEVTKLAAESLNLTIEPILNAQKGWYEAHRAQIEKALASVGPHVNWFQRMDKPLQDALAVLGENGWFLCMNLPITAISRLREAFENGDAEEAENALMTYFENRLDVIETAVISRFPTRSKVLKSAFSAHRRGEFELSIPVLLAQSDGISKELFDGYIFKTEKKRPEAAAFVQTLSNDNITRTFLSQLTLKFPINRSRGERPPDFVGFNRHEILHGDSSDYGTRANALKAVSLLNYVATAFDPKE